MSRQIEMAFKSTLDFIVTGLAERLSIAHSAANPVFAFDLDDLANERQLQAGAEHALVFQYTNLAEDPIHPLYSVTFLVGAKTTADPGNYGMTDLLTDLRQEFPAMNHFSLYDYSAVGEGEELGPEMGVLVIQSVDTGPQMFEKQSGIRLLQVSGKVMAYGPD